ncbi:hypothetical protein [Pseudoneobacillus sp. C159]
MEKFKFDLTKARSCQKFLVAFSYSAASLVEQEKVSFYIAFEQ